MVASMEMQTINSMQSWDLRAKLKEYAKVLNVENHHSDYVFIEALISFPLTTITSMYFL